MYPMLKMMISILFTFASTTVKIYVEFSENEIIDKMKGIIAIVSSIFVVVIETRKKQKQKY